MNAEFPLGLLLGILALLIACSAFFSGSETGMMSINRYRLSHKAKQGDKAAIRISNLLKRPDRLLGVILIGNNFVNNFAAAIATVIAIHFLGESLGPLAATFALTIVVLIFAEVTPKTLAALHPEQFARPASFALTPLLKLLYPLVWIVNLFSNFILRLLGARPDEHKQDNLTSEELRTVVNEAGNLIPSRHQAMLLSILDMEKITVDDIMIPRQEVTGIDLEQDMDTILELLRHSQHTRIPVYKGDINNVIGILHLRGALRLIASEKPSKGMLIQETREPYFIPESTPLQTQLLNFQKEKRRIGIVVDEYGDVQGLVTLEDILEEIVGEFTTDVPQHQDDIQPQQDGSWLIDASATIREINKQLEWELPTHGPKTLNGLILEHLESIPDGNICVAFGSYRIETLEVKENLIKAVRCWEDTSKKRKKLLRRKS
ncbi:MAG: HlyC/CorC family transporter [Marinospirillum sp.]|uniref:HlyC/CorC family transporter n=1 Tax=Marinospirillum sp. TaxID=2183934 RepID=UPI0019D8DA09|nr:HlyC/CorC family transporter [Marinospirillum sp.]MBE0505820.1 HlyC/CorC family transporter [Marinospirillum sp.]